MTLTYKQHDIWTTVQRTQDALSVSKKLPTHVIKWLEGTALILLSVSLKWHSNRLCTYISPVWECCSPSLSESPTVPNATCSNLAKCQSGRTPRVFFLINLRCDTVTFRRHRVKVPIYCISRRKMSNTSSRE